MINLEVSQTQYLGVEQKPEPNYLVVYRWVIGQRYLILEIIKTLHWIKAIVKFRVFKFELLVKTEFVCFEFLLI